MGRGNEMKDVGVVDGEEARLALGRPHSAAAVVERMLSVAFLHIPLFPPLL